MADTKVKRLRHGSRARHARSLGGDICNFVLLAVVGFFMIIPLVYTVCNAFKPVSYTHLDVYKRQAQALCMV